MEINWYIIPIAALIPLIIGAIWYNPKVFGTAWLNASGLTEKEAQGGNMFLIFGLSYLFSMMICTMMISTTIHQFSTQGLFASQPEFEDTASNMYQYMQSFLKEWGHLHRTFGHGAIHGGIAAAFLALPIIGILSLFERRGAKYIFIHFGYWLITLSLIGGVICQFA